VIFVGLMSLCISAKGKQDEKVYCQSFTYSLKKLEKPLCAWAYQAVVNVNKQTETRAEPCDLTFPDSLEHAHTHTLESSLPRVCDPRTFCFFYSLARRNSRLSREGVQVNNIEG